MAKGPLRSFGFFFGCGFSTVFGLVACSSGESAVVTASGGNLGSGGAAIGGSVATSVSGTIGGANSGGSSAVGGLTSSGGVANGGATSNSTGGSTVGSTGGTTVGGATAAGGATAVSEWKIMTLGDSITATTCYPQLLSKNLIAAGHTHFKLIGSVLNNQACGATHVQTEGHSSQLVVAKTNDGSVASWLTANPPDAVVLHFATNDVWGNGGTGTANNILAAYSKILTQLRTINPKAILFVAQIIPVNPSSNSCSAASPCNYQATLNSMIPAWATANTTATSPVISVNLETIFTSGYFPGTTYTTDGVHPLAAGAQLMADTLTPVLLANLPGI